MLLIVATIGCVAIANIAVRIFVAVYSAYDTERQFKRRAEREEGQSRHAPTRRITGETII